MCSQACIVQTVASALKVAALFYDRAAICLLGLSAWLVVLFACSSAWRICLPSLSGRLVCLLGVFGSGHLTLVCHFGVKSRNGLHGIWLHTAVWGPEGHLLARIILGNSQPAQTIVKVTSVAALEKIISV